jgi:hypothetical protein
MFTEYGVQAEVRMIGGGVHVGVLRAEVRDSRGHPILLSVQTKDGKVGLPWTSVVDVREPSPYLKG